MDEVFELKRKLEEKEDEKRIEEERKAVLINENIKKFNKLVKSKNIRLYFGDVNLYTETRLPNSLEFLAFNLADKAEGRVSKRYVGGILRVVPDLSFNLEYPVRVIESNISLEEKNLLRGKLNKAIHDFFGKDYEVNLENAIETTKSSIRAEINLIEKEGNKL